MVTTDREESEGGVWLGTPRFQSTWAFALLLSLSIVCYLVFRFFVSAMFFPYTNINGLVSFVPYLWLCGFLFVLSIAAVCLVPMGRRHPVSTIVFSLCNFFIGFYTFENSILKGQSHGTPWLSELNLLIGIANFGIWLTGLSLYDGLVRRRQRL